MSAAAPSEPSPPPSPGHDRALRLPFGQPGLLLAQAARRAEPALVFAVLLAMFGLLFLGSVQMGLAYDEIFHLPAGVGFGVTGQRVTTIDHPPLGHRLAWLGARVLEPDFDRALYLRSDPSKPAFEIGFAFLRANEQQLRLLLLLARLPTMIAAVVGALYAYLLGRSLWGRRAGMLALLLCAFAPVFLAWSRFVYLDGLLASVTMAAFAHLVWYLKGRRPTQLFALAAASAAVLCTKYSGVFIAPIVVVAMLLPPDRFGEAPVAVGRRARDLALFLATTALVMWALFGFPSDPAFYFRGMSKLYAGATPGYRFYLLGRFETGWWWFYPFLFVVKSTLPALAFAALAALTLGALGARAGDPAARRGAWPLLLLLAGAFGFLVLTAWKALPIGARYLAPMYPLLAVAAGAVLVEVRARFGAAAPRVEAALFLLAGLHVVSTLRSYPDELGYFNELVGGSARGIYVSNDASLDAGQNLPRLARYLRTLGNPPVRLLYQGVDDPQRYGIRTLPVGQGGWDGELAPGLYAISSYPLSYGQLGHRENPARRDWLTTMTPKAIIGNSIWVYEVPPR